MSDATTGELLAALGKRIEKVALDPKAIEKQGFFRVARPLYSLTRWRARVGYGALEALVTTLGSASKTRAIDESRAAVDAAARELEGNVDTIERVAILRARAPVAYAAWLRRTWELVILSDRAVSALEAGVTDEDALRLASRVDRTRVRPPLALSTPKKVEPNTLEPPDAFLSEVPTRAAEVPEPEADGRLVELELAAIDHLLAAARDEGRFLGRRRRLLVAARQRLLEASAALPLDRGGVRVRADHVAREIARIDRFETAGLSVDAGLVHQARLAIDRGDPRRAYAALAALEGAAVASGDGVLATLASRGVHTMWRGEDPTSAGAALASLERSATELLGTDVVDEVKNAMNDARTAAEVRLAGIDGAANRQYELAQVGEDAAREVLHATVAVDGCFEVGGALAPVRIMEEERVLRQVRHPTQDMVLVAAREPEDLPDAIIADPRTVLLDLATGRLLARRFVREESVKRSKIMMRSEVRVYVLDGSGSMRGPRARVRDALLVAELATLIARLQAPGTTRCTLFYRYFDEDLGHVYRVDGIASAKAAVRDVVGTLREGGTDIQKALLASLEQVDTARSLDADLARAQIVLVTDGEAAVDEQTIVNAKDAISSHGLPIGVSVIALGQENEALRALVAHQRAKGERAFYHFVDDAQCAAIAAGELDAGLPVHLPDGGKELSPQLLARELEREIGPLVDELASLERGRDITALDEIDVTAQARREAGLTDAGIAAGNDGGTRGDGERARLEALNRDRTALGARFARWFPAPAPAAAHLDRSTPIPLPTRGSVERDDIDATTSALASVAEVVDLLGGSELARRADAIELLERLLPDAHLTPARYRVVLRDWPLAVAPGLSAIHAAVSSPGSSGSSP